MKKRIALLLFAALTFSVLPFVILSSASNTEPIVLYKNDTRFFDTEFPAEQIDGTVYVPSSFFIGLKGVMYEYRPEYRSFYFLNTETGRYFAFSFNNDNIIVDNERVNISFPILNSTIYMPLEYCAEILSLGIETLERDSVLSIRLNDGTQSLSFDKLIELFDPKEPDVTDPDDPPVAPPEIKPVDPPVSTEKKTVYLMIEAKDADILSEMLDALDGFDEKATVFFSNELIVSHPTLVLRTLVDRHGTGIAATDSEGVGTMDALRQANSSLTHLFSRAERLAIVPKSLESHAELTEAGYVIWTPTDVCGNTPFLSDRERAKLIYEAALERKESAVLISTDNGVNMLLALLGHFANDQSFVISKIDTVSPQIEIAE